MRRLPALLLGVAVGVVFLGSVATAAGAVGRPAPPLSDGARPATEIPGWQAPPVHGQSWFFDSVRRWWLVTCGDGRTVYDLNDPTYRASGVDLPVSTGSMSSTVDLGVRAAIVGTSDQAGTEVAVDSGCVPSGALMHVADVYQSADSLESIPGGPTAPFPEARGLPVLPGDPLPSVPVAGPFDGRPGGKGSSDDGLVTLIGLAIFLVLAVILGLVGSLLRRRSGGGRDAGVSFRQYPQHAGGFTDPRPGPGVGGGGWDMPEPAGRRYPIPVPVRPSGVWTTPLSDGEPSTAVGFSSQPQPEAQDDPWGAWGSSGHGSGDDRTREFAVPPGEPFGDVDVTRRFDRPDESSS